MWKSKGEDNKRAKLTWAKVKEIRRLDRYYEFTQKELAEKFGVAQRTISSVITGERWHEWDTPDY